MSEIKISPKVNKIIGEIDELTVGESYELVEGIKVRYNIKEDVVIQSTAATPGSEKSEEKTGNVSVKWVEIKAGGLKPIEVYGLIKEAVNELKGEAINIVQAKKLTETENKIILADIPQDKAEAFKKKMEEKQVEVKIV